VWIGIVPEGFDLFELFLSLQVLVERFEGQAKILSG